MSVHVLLSSMQSRRPEVRCRVHNITDHTAVSVFVMYLIAVTIVACDVLVLLAKGVDAMPFGIIGVIGSLVFVAAALGDGAVRQAPAAALSVDNDSARPERPPSALYHP